MCLLAQGNTGKRTGNQGRLVVELIIKEKRLFKKAICQEHNKVKCHALTACHWSVTPGSA